MHDHHCSERWYLVQTATESDSEEASEQNLVVIEQWLWDNVDSNSWDYSWQRGGYLFRRKADALMFGLTWC